MRRKTLYTLNVNKYEPAVTALTYPLLRLYARKIGAEFFQITERKSPDWPLMYEKLQIFHLAKERGDEWSVYVDSDTLIRPDTPDFTAIVPRDHVAHYRYDFAPLRWYLDEHFLRDGRRIGTCGWFCMASNWCRDLWHPSDLTPEETIARCFPVLFEAALGLKPEHFVEDYTISRNIARFGLKAIPLLQVEKQIGFRKEDDDTDAGGPGWFHHVYAVSPQAKVASLREVIYEKWKVPKSIMEAPA
jgi:hypothetical protein